MVICGLDECGRGALAGPLVAGAVVLSDTYEKIVGLLPSPLRDSKRMTKLQRQHIYDLRDHIPITFSIESISVDEINEKGITWANKEIFIRLSRQIKADQYLVDGNISFQESGFISVVHGDNLHPQIMMASVLAKVYRDRLMATLHNEHPLYHWDRNVGYGTGEHISALSKFGLTPHHRQLFAYSALKKVILSEK